MSDGLGTAGPLSTTAFFYSSDNDPDFLPTANGPAVAVSNIFVNSAYTGSVIDHNDIAVLRLAEETPAFAASYDLSLLTDLTGELFNVAGYGARSTIGGNFGANAGTGRLRQGDDRMEYRFGDPDFQNTWYGIVGPASRTEFSYVSDFDNGLAANDTSCRIMSVTSYGLTFGTTFGDIRAGLNSSFGEYNGFVPVYLHEQLTRDNMNRVPMPGSACRAAARPDEKDEKGTLPFSFSKRVTSPFRRPNGDAALSSRIAGKRVASPFPRRRAAGWCGRPC